MNVQTVSTPGTPALVSDDVTELGTARRPVRLASFARRLDLAVRRQRDETSTHCNTPSPDSIQPWTQTAYVYYSALVRFGASGEQGLQKFVIPCVERR